MQENNLKSIIDQDDQLVEKEDIKLLELYENSIIAILSRWYNKFLRIKNKELEVTTLGYNSFDDLDNDFIQVFDGLEILFAAEKLNYNKLFNQFSNEIDEIECIDPNFDLNAMIVHLKDAMQQIIFCNDLKESLKAIIRFRLCSDRDIFETIVKELSITDNQLSKDDSINNGGKTDYYNIPPEVTTISEFFIYNNFSNELKEIFLLILNWNKKDNIKCALEIINNIKENKSSNLEVTDYPMINKKLNEFNIEIKECNDFIDLFDIGFNLGEAFKVVFCYSRGRHEGTSKEREINKIIYYLNRELYKQHNIKNNKIKEINYKEL